MKRKRKMTQAEVDKRINQVLVVCGTLVLAIVFVIAVVAD